MMKEATYHQEEVLMAEELAFMEAEANLYYDAIRETLRPEYQEISNEEVDALLSQTFASMGPEEAEAYAEFLGKLWKKAKKSVGGFVKKNIGKIGTIAGGALGTLIPIPGVGTAIGSAIGRKLGGLASRGVQRLMNRGAKGLKRGVRRISRSRNRRFRPRQTRQRYNPYQPQPRSFPRTPFARSRFRRPPARNFRGQQSPQRRFLSRRQPQSSANQLMALLNNPRLARSLLAAVNGQAGRRSESVFAENSYVNIPIESMFSALAELAQRVAMEVSEGRENDTPSYLTDSEGNFVVDPSSASERADYLLALLSEEYEEEEEFEEEDFEEEDYEEEDFIEEYEEEESEYDELTEWFVNSGMLEQ